MEKTIKSNQRKKKRFEAVVFPMMSTTVLTANSITPYLSLFQEKLLYITIGLVFLLVIHHKIRSRVSYTFVTNRRGR